MKRGRSFIAWEYLFYFGGGTPPVDERNGAGHRHPGARARGRRCSASRTTWRRPAGRWAHSRRRRRPACARTGPAAGVHYLQYSFAPRLYIFNAFLAVADRAPRLSADSPATSARASSSRPPSRRRARRFRCQRPRRLVALLLRAATSRRVELPRAAARVPGRACARAGSAPIYCDYARRYRGYQVDPPELELARARASAPRTSRRRSASTCRSSRPSRSRSRARRQGRLQPAGDVPAAATASFSWTPARPGLLHGAARREGAAHRARQAATATAARSRSPSCEPACRASAHGIGGA